ncbi:MAG TPA: hypothetical protein VKW06_08980 [Candidatus Angelobacter sp.]|nr:hypothetical protein [Candidatus Angelobacter sp.]
MPDLLNVLGLANKLNVLPSWVRARLRSRTPAPLKIPGIVRVGRHIRFRPDIIDAWIENGCKLPLPKAGGANSDGKLRSRK